MGKEKNEKEVVVVGFPGFFCSLPGSGCSLDADKYELGQIAGRSRYPQQIK